MADSKPRVLLDEPDPEVLDVLERLLRQRHERLAETRLKYQACANGLAAARAAEGQARKAWEGAQAALKTAERELDHERQELDGLTRHADAELQRELALAVRALRSMKQ